MNKYEKYDLEDFASDDAFISWCLHPNKSSNLFWTNWIKNHPQQKSIILNAKQLVLDLNTIEREEHVTNFKTSIWENIDKEISKPRKTRRVFQRKWAYPIAASLLLIISAFWFLKPNYTVTEQTASLKTEWLNFENNLGVTKTIKLSDGSVVQLEPFSSLKYPSTFEAEQRTVFLKGEAFFDIERDTSKPFLVYANETITKVLGTSFRITAFEGQETIEVEVKTGKVAVYAKVASDNTNEDKRQILVQTDEQIFVPRPNKKLEVTPNQKVVFDRQEAEMKKTVTSLPLLITNVEELPQFHFDDSPANTVFEALEQAYGIDFEYDKEKFRHCTIRTTLDDEPLFQKLEIICMALGAKFTEKDAVIHIEGTGCN